MVRWLRYELSVVQTILQSLGYMPFPNSCTRSVKIVHLARGHDVPQRLLTIDVLAQIMSRKLLVFIRLERILVNLEPFVEPAVHNVKDDSFETQSPARCVNLILKRRLSSCGRICHFGVPILSNRWRRSHVRLRRSRIRNPYGRSNVFWCQRNSG